MNTVLRAVGFAFLVVLAGCSTPPEPNDRVATLETTGSAPPSVSASSGTTPTASRPRERLDMTNDELNEMYEAYSRCLADNGYDTGKGGGGGAEVAPAVPDESKRVAAETACLNKNPLPPWEYDTANPESADFVHALVQCLRDKGVRLVEESPLNPGDDRRSIALGGPDNDQDSITKGLDLIPTCEKEEARGR